MASAAVKAASAAEAGASARGKALFLSAATVAAESAGANAALTARLSIAASGAAVAAERLRSSATLKSTAGVCHGLTSQYLPALNVGEKFRYLDPRSISADDCLARL